VCRVAPRQKDADFHVVAFVKVGDNIIAACNDEKSSPKYLRWYNKGCTNCAYSGHAEMILLSKVKNIRRKTIYVTRFLYDGTPTMARPCRLCQQHLYDAGVKSIRYTDWNGLWNTLEIKKHPY